MYEFRFMRTFNTSPEIQNWIPFGSAFKHSDIQTGPWELFELIILPVASINGDYWIIGLLFQETDVNWKYRETLCLEDYSGIKEMKRMGNREIYNRELCDFIFVLKHS